MSVNPKYLIYHDLIGFYCLAKQNKKKGEFKDIGMVIEDSRNMLITEKENNVKKN